MKRLACFFPSRRQLLGADPAAIAHTAQTDVAPPLPKQILGQSGRAYIETWDAQKLAAKRRELRGEPEEQEEAEGSLKQDFRDLATEFGEGGWPLDPPAGSPLWHLPPCGFPLSHRTSFPARLRLAACLPVSRGAGPRLPPPHVRAVAGHA